MRKRRVDLFFCLFGNPPEFEPRPSLSIGRYPLDHHGDQHCRTLKYLSAASIQNPKLLRVQYRSLHYCQYTTASTRSTSSISPRKYSYTPHYWEHLPSIFIVGFVMGPDLTTPLRCT